MPIRINLKELFSSDPQEINVEKVNFNFNKLLELGIGTPGPVGSTGPQGPAGPIGQTGPQGPRGATWWVGSGDPNTLLFSGLIDGDLYLDQVSFSTWEYDLSTNTWTQVASISTSVTNYLNQTGGSPFAKDFADTTSPLNSRFTVFRQRKSTTPETGRGSLITSDNDILFLNNYNDTGFFGSGSQGDLYNSLLSISVDHATSTTADTSRYHLELSSVYSDNGTNKISNIKNNLKVHFYKFDLAGNPYLSSTNIGNAAWINTAEFSVSLPNLTNLIDPNNGVNSNGAFRFKTPKLNLEGGSNLRDELVISMGPWEAITEFDADFNPIRANGITFSLTQAQINSTIGIADNYQSIYTRLDNKDLFMLDTHSLIEGVLINKKTFIIGNTNVIGKVSIGDLDPTSHLTVSGNASIGVAYNAINAPTDGLIVKGKVGVNHSAPASYFTVAGNAAIGDSYKAIAAPTDGLIVEGKSGIGTSAPTAKLHIINTDATEDSFRVDDSSSDTTPFVIDSAGSVGIGRLVPSAPLDITSYSAPTNSALPDGLVLVLNRNNTTNVQDMSFYTNGSANYMISHSPSNNSKSLIFNATTDQSDTPFVAPSTSINIDFQVLGKNILRITDTERVGIGTTAPASKLHIVGTTNVIKIDTDNADAGKALVCSDNNGSADWQPITNFGVPVGAVMPYAGSAAPTGWLLCNGGNIPAGSQYDNLRAVLGTQTVPNLAERFIVGAGSSNSQGGPYPLGSTGGAPAISLTEDQVPLVKHRHHTSSGQGTNTDPDSGAYQLSDGTINIVDSGWHAHGMFDTSDGGGNDARVLETGSYEGEKFDNTYNFTTQGATHSHIIDDFRGTTGRSYRASISSHENRPPYYALNYIIKY